MGAPRAGHLLGGGHEVTSWLHKTPAPEELTKKGLKLVKTPKDVAAASEVVITMVPDTPQVEAVLFGDNGVAAGLKKGTLAIDMSSISPIETKVFAERINKLGCDYLDAPVSGGEVGAKAASLTIMVGGSEAAFEKDKPTFALMGKNITLVGPNGVGQTTKVANQIVVTLTLPAIGEALVFASQAGPDPAQAPPPLTGGPPPPPTPYVHRPP